MKSRYWIETMWMDLSVTKSSSRSQQVIEDREASIKSRNDWLSIRTNLPGKEKDLALKSQNEIEAYRKGAKHEASDTFRCK